MPFGRVIGHEVQSNTVLDSGLGFPTGGGDCGGLDLQLAALLPIAKPFGLALVIHAVITQVYACLYIKYTSLLDLL